MNAEVIRNIKRRDIAGYIYEFYYRICKKADFIHKKTF